MNLKRVQRPGCFLWRQRLAFHLAEFTKFLKQEQTIANVTQSYRILKTGEFTETEMHLPFKQKAL